MKGKWLFKVIAITGARVIDGTGATTLVLVQLTEGCQA
jgi:hypothetical protein